ncbi:EAL domain-containing protein [Thalassotalea piscium]
MPQVLVLHHRHSKLFLLLCFIPVTLFAYVHYLKENYILSCALALTAIVFALNFLNIKDNQISCRSKASIVVSMWCCLALGCYYVGLHGIFYAFPSIAGLFFLVSIRIALFISVPSVFILLALTMLHGEPPETLKLVTSFLLTIIFTAYSAYFSKHQQDVANKESKKDSLTDVENRQAFNKWLSDCHENKKIDSITSINLDIDNFRIINDTLGFDIGDKIIQQLAIKITSIIDNSQVVDCAYSLCIARCSGDAFVIGLTNLPEDKDLLPLIESLKSAVSQLTIVKYHGIKVSASVALVRTARIEGGFANIIDNVELTLRQAKLLGKNTIKIFDESVGEQLKEQKYIAKELAQAIKNNEFHMALMPIYRDNKETIIGAELLLRCDRKELKAYGPDTFIPIAENYGLIEAIDFWVLNESFRLIANSEKLRIPGIEFYSINISSYQLHNNEFVNSIQNILHLHKLDPKYIELEITETSLVETDLQAVETLVSLRRIGFKLSLDDFGTGYTAFNQLKKYPLNCLKIDRSFVSGDQENTTPLIGMSLVILSIAKLYNYNVIAEGVETEKQYLELKNNGCHYFQGYWFSKPISVNEFESLLIKTSR